MAKAPNIRNVAIIAHVDHGKTTLVDALMQQSGLYGERDEVVDRAMDSMDLERERGITIAAKNCTIKWQDLTINIVDTPGHSDFGGEVERILSMVDGALVLVDAAEGPLPQTRFVLRKAIEANLELVVVINKIDRPDQRTVEVEDEILSLMIDCDATDKHLECPVLYAIAKDGKATRSLAHLPESMEPIFETIRDFIPAPKVDTDAPLSMIVANLGYSDFVGRLAIGRMKSGTLKKGDHILSVGDGVEVKGKVSHLYGYEGMKSVDIQQAEAGEIIAIAGFEETTIGDTLTSIENPLVQPRINVEEATVEMVFGANTSPLTGKDGKFVTSRQLRDRLWKEKRRNVSLRIEEGESSDKFKVAGRGELQLAILIEQLRREDYELEVSRPEVITRDVDGETCEPFENLVLDLGQEFTGAITELLGSRRGVMINMSDAGSGRVRLEFLVPSRGLIGIRSTMLTKTRGTCIPHSVFDGYKPWAGAIPTRTAAALISDRDCTSTPFAIGNLEARGTLFLPPGTETYSGMIVGESAKEKDIPVFIGRPKKQTNIRAAGSDDAVNLTPHKQHTLESAMEWINNDELIEVTPKEIRLRKRTLDPHVRKSETKKVQNLSE